MDENKILLVNVAKGRIGEDNSALLGAMMITKFNWLPCLGLISRRRKKRFFLVCG